MNLIQEIKDRVSEYTKDEKEYTFKERYLNWDRNGKYIGSSKSFPKPNAEKSKKYFSIQSVGVDGNEEEYIATIDKVKSVATPVEEFNPENEKPRD